MIRRHFVSISLLALGLAAVPAALAAVPLTGATAVAAGFRHACAIVAGGVKCWGNNSDGQLGVPGTDYRPTPVAVTGLSSGVTAIATSYAHTCAVVSGGAKCWGDNIRGQLGNGATADSFAPVDVNGLQSGVSAISAGDLHTCALVNGGAQCWGSNDSGQLGNGTTTNSSTPVSVTGLSSGVVAIQVGGYHSCALLTGGALKCWGRNGSGELGDGSTTQRLTPVDVPGFATGTLSASGGGGHTCAVPANGSVMCWGENGLGQLADGTNTDRPSPQAVPGLAAGVAAVEAGSYYSCALTTGGGVKCWGTLPTALDPGMPPGLQGTPVLDVAGLGSGVAAVSAGQQVACALMSTGRVRCWGQNFSGQLGDNGNTPPAGTLTPVEVLYDSKPAAFTFPSQADVPVNSVRTSAAVVPTGYEVDAIVSVSEGSYSIGCTGTFTTVPGVISPGQSVCLRHISSNLLASMTTTTITIEGVAATFTSTTVYPLQVTQTNLPQGSIGVAYQHALGATGGTTPYVFTLASGSMPAGFTLSPQGVISGTPSSYGFFTFDVRVDDSAGQSKLQSLGILVPDQAPDPFGFAAQSGVPATSVRISNTITPTGYSYGATVTVSNGEFSVGCTAGFTTNPASIGPGDSVCVRHISSSTPGGSVTTTLTIGGVAGTFTSSTSGAAVSTLTVTKAGTGTGTVSSPQSGIDCGVDCTESYAAGTPVTLVASAAAGSSFVGWSGDCTGNGACQLAMSAARNVTATFSPGALGLAPATLDFGGQSMGTTSFTRTLTVTNTGTGAVTVTGVTTAAPFAVTHGCNVLAAGASCTAAVTFTPVVEGGVVGSLNVQSSAGNAGVVLGGVGEKSLVGHYYQSILRREPDSGGKGYWNGEASRVVGLGANVNEVWFAMAQQFYFSAEYAAFNRDNTGFVTDLYDTFFNRAPDSAGLAYWVGNLDSGMPREVALTEFMFSAEFRNFTQAIFGNTAARAEVDAVMDFYRGLLARLPDNGGFTYWVGRFRAAQCLNAAVVTAEADAMSGAFTTSPEYAARARTNAQYVGDLYNAFLRRGGDLSGVQFWINQLDTGARTREQVRVAFRDSAEFQARVTAIVNQGCSTPS